MSEFNWNYSVVCKQCKRMFAFHRAQDFHDVTFPKGDLSEAGAQCPFCHNYAVFARKEWLYPIDSKDDQIKKLKEDNERLKKENEDFKAEVKKLKEENAKFRR